MTDVSEKRPIFGNRYLTSDSDVFGHNAWDDVEWDEEQENAAKDAVSKNSTITLAENEIQRLESEAGENWNKFYGIHQNRFFKDRNWLFTEFPELSGSDKTILEIGCGVGNSVFPILETNPSPEFKLFCCDFSTTAIDILKDDPKYIADPRCSAFVCDITSDSDWKDSGIEKESLDIVLCVFVLSALDPRSMDTAVSNISQYLKPGGLVLFRDYGRYDLAQLRFKKGRCLDKDFYARGDGTRCYFFTKEYLKDLFVTRHGFEELQNKYDKRLQVNRGKQLKMYRVWLQAKFTKKY